MALAVPLELEFQFQKDLEDVTNSHEMKQYIKEQYPNMNISETFADLHDCGSLLHIAIAHAGDEPCSVPILKTLSKYQDLVHASAIVSAAFVQGSLGALRCHKEAVEMFEEATEEGDLAEGLAELVGCAKMAERMEKKAEELEVKTDDLIQLAEEGLIQAKEDMNKNKAESKKYDDQVKQMQADAAAREKRRELLHADLDEASEREEKAALEASQARSRQFTMDIIGLVADGLKSLNPISAISNAVSGGGNGGKGGDGGGQQTVENDGDLTAAKDQARTAQGQLVSLKKQLSDANSSPDCETVEGKQLIERLEEDLKKQQDATNEAETKSSKFAEALEKRAATLEAKEAEASKYRRELLKQKREVASDIAKSLEEIKNMKFQKSKAEQVYTTLITALKTMGLVKTTFANTKDFWKQVKESCSRLAGFQSQFQEKVDIVIKKMKTADGGKLVRPKKHLLTVVKQSAIGWAGIGRICLDAAVACEKARVNVDNVVKNGLGDTDEAVKDLVGQLGGRLAKKIQDAKE